MLTDDWEKFDFLLASIFSNKEDDLQPEITKQNKEDLKLASKAEEIWWELTTSL